MEHPEKALFDEVRGFRSEIEDSKERIFQVEKEYLEKVENLEKRMEIATRCDQKIKMWKDQTKQRVTFNVNDKEYQFLRTTFTENIYNVSSEFLPENQDYIYPEIDKKFFKALIEIIRRGNNAKLNEKAKRYFETLLDKKIREDDNFVACVKNFFDEESVVEVSKNFGLKLIYRGKCSEEKLFVTHSLNNPYTYSTIHMHASDNVKSLSDKSGRKAFFLNYEAKLDITLSESIRTDKIYIMPFTHDLSNWSPTNGGSYAKIHGSLDGINYELYATLPSYYGAYSNNYLCEIELASIFSFKYLRFETDENSLFSLAYLSFKK